MERDDDELRVSLGTLWRTAVSGWGTVREVVYRSAQSGRLRFDIAMLQRQRATLLEELGGAVRELIARHELELPGSLRDLIDQLDDIEGRLRRGIVRSSDNAFGAPRGYEPEAASYYGDGELDDSDIAAAAADLPPPARATKAKKKVPARKKKAGPQKRVE